MHETVIAAELLKQAQKHGIPKHMVIVAGELGHVPPDELLQTLKKMTTATIQMSIEQALIQCPCGFSGRPTILARGHDFALYECKKCGNAPPLTQGKDIKLISVEIEK